jgi:Protein of unknown function (DUF3489)
MSIKLTVTQLALVTAASLRDDHCVAPSKNLKGSAAQKIFARLSAEGLAKEVIAKAGMPVWRRDEGVGRSYSLKLTAAGLKAAPAESDNSRTDADETPVAGIVVEDPVVAAATSTEADATSPREGTKIAKVLGLLRRSDGATLSEVIAATGWLPHTTRAALTGLRKRGYAVSIDRSDKERGSIYRIGGNEQPADAAIAHQDKVLSAPRRRLKMVDGATVRQARKAT